MKELYFEFEGKDFKAKVTANKYYSLDYYHVVLNSEELIKRFSIGYIFCYSDAIRLQYVSTVQRPRNDDLVEVFTKALRESLGV